MVVHGHHAARMQRIAHRLCSGGIHCVNTPDRHQHGVHRADGRRLLRRQLVPQIAQMGHRQAAGCKNSDRVGPPQRAAPVIMKGLYLPDRKRAFPLWQQLHTVCGVMVKMAVAAKNGVSLYVQRRVPRHAGIRVQYNAIAVLLQKKTGVSQPGQLHNDPS